MQRHSSSCAPRGVPCDGGVSSTSAFVSGARESDGDAIANVIVITAIRRKLVVTTAAAAKVSLTRPATTANTSIVIGIAPVIRVIPVIPATLIGTIPVPASSAIVAAFVGNIASTVIGTVTTNIGTHADITETAAMVIVPDAGPVPLWGWPPQ